MINKNKQRNQRKLTTVLMGRDSAICTGLPLKIGVLPNSDRILNSLDSVKIVIALHCTYIISF